MRPLRRINRIAIISAISFTLLATSSIAATYAWFSIREYARINQISLSTQQGANLEIGYRSTDGDVIYKSQLGEDDFQVIDPHYDTNKNLRDVSSMFQADWLDTNIPANEKTPVLLESYSRSSARTKTPQAKSHFLQFELFFRSSESGHLYLGDDTYLRPSQNDNERVSILKGIPTEKLNNVANAARISFYSENAFYICEANPIQDEPTVFAGPLSIHNQEGYYDHSEGKEILYGSYRGEPQYLPALEFDQADVSSHDSFHAIHKAGVSPIDLSSIEPEIEETNSLQEFIFDGASSITNKKALGPLRANEDFRLVITIYLEGWDKDLTEEVLEGRFDVNLSFALHLDL